jgi:hypothetical protein
MKDEEDMNGNIDHKCEIIKVAYYLNYRLIPVTHVCYNGVIVLLL